MAKGAALSEEAGTGHCGEHPVRSAAAPTHSVFPALPRIVGCGGPIGLPPMGDSGH